MAHSILDVSQQIPCSCLNEPKVGQWHIYSKGFVYPSDADVYLYDDDYINWTFTYVEGFFCSIIGIVGLDLL